MNIDTLDIQFKTTGAEQTQSSLNNLVGSITRLNSALGQMNGTGLSSFASGLNRLGNSVKGVTAIRSTSIDTIVNKFNKLSNINSASLTTSAKALDTLSRSISGVSASTQSLNSLNELSKTMRSFGNKSFANASVNVDKLTTSLKNMVNSLSNVKNINQSVIQMTNAMANLASQSKGLNALQFNSSMKNLGNDTKKSASGLTSLNSSLKETRSHAKNASGGIIELARAFGKFYASLFLVIRGLKALGNAIESAMDYVETYNYYNVVTDKIASEFPEGFRQIGEDSADAYYMGFTDKMEGLLTKMTGYDVGNVGELYMNNQKNLGLDPNQIMSYQARIASITNSVGQMGQVSTVASNALSMLASDLSSLTNTDLSEVMNNLASGLLGQARAMYKYGVDITNATLQQYALQYGVQKSVSEMTQMEKQQLRLIAILDQTRVAWGDQANTLNSVANQYRMMKQQLANVARTIGNLFLPVIQKVLPYVNALIIVIQRLLNLLGFKIHGGSWLTDIMDGTSKGFGGAVDDIEDMEDSIEGAGSGMADVADNADDAQKNLDKAQQKAKKLKDYVLGIDELNIIKPQDDDPDTDISKDIDALDNALKNNNKGSGSGGGGGMDLSDAIDDLFLEYESVWDKAFEDAINKAQELADKLWDILKKIWDIAEPTRKALADLWDNGLKKLMQFNGKTLYDFWKNFLQPVGMWLLSDKSGLPRLFNILNDMLNKINWNYLQTQLRNLYLALQEVAKFSWNSLMGFIEYFLAPLATWTMSSAIPQLANILTQFIYRVNWSAITEALNNFWKALEPFAQNVGQGLINFFNSLSHIGSAFLNTLPSIFNGLAKAIGMIPSGMAEALGEALGFLLTTILAFKAITGVTKIFNAFSTKFFEFIGGTALIGKTVGALGKLCDALFAVGGAMLGNEASASALVFMYPKLYQALDKVREGFLLIKARNFGQMWDNLKSSVTNLTNAMSPLAKTTTVAVAAFLGFKSIKSIILDATNGIIGFMKFCFELIGVVTAMGVAFTIALGPIAGLIATAGVLATAFAVAVAENEKLTSSYSDSAKELATYGQSVDDLTQKITAQGLAIEQSNDNILRSRDSIITSGQAEIAVAEELADKYFDLAEKTNRTSVEEDLMRQYLDQLCSTVPTLSQYINEQTGLLDIQRESVYKLIEAEQERAKAEAIYQLMVDAERNLIQAEMEHEQALGQVSTATDEYMSASQEVKDAENELAEAESRLAEEQAKTFSDKDKVKEYKQDIEDAKEKLAEATTELERCAENQNKLAMASAETQKALSDSQNVLTELTDKYTEYQTESVKATQEAEIQIAESMGRTVGYIKDADGEIQNVTIEGGKNVAEGYAQGIDENAYLVSDSARQMTTDMTDTVATEMDMHSPSRKAMEWGQFIDEGLAQGITENEQVILDAITQLATDIETAFLTMFGGGGEGEMSLGVEGGGGGGLFGGMLTSFQTACQQIIDYVTMTFVPLLTTTFQTAFGGGIGMGSIGMGGIGGMGMGGGVGGMGMDGMGGGLFGGLFTNFQTTCQMIIDYITATFIPMITEALLAFVESFQTDILDVLNEKITEWCDLILTDVITPFIENTLEMYEDMLETMVEDTEDACDEMAEAFEKMSEAVCKAIQKIEKAIDKLIQKIEKAIAKLKQLMSMGGGGIGGFKDGGYVKGYASGGFVNGIPAYANGSFATADLFYANENGVPELVGTLNGHTAVTSGKEITGISNAVYEASANEVNVMNTMVGYLQTIANKDISFSIDSRELVTAIDNRRQRNGFSFT